MQENTRINDPIDSGNEDDFGPEPFRGFTKRRAIVIVLVLLTVVLMALLPPLFNVNRYKRQIVTSISTSLGRPVHIDSVSLNLLPLPSFTLTNFVISEDPSFGFEPVLLANEVHATLRVSSLWRRRVEFSRIALDSPSVNLVHRADGRWNLESILLQASRMPAAPTGQKQPGPAQRFPYIEATSARVNLKMGLEKMPLSLTEADFALWLPEPNEWNLRLKAHPARTDAPPADTGILRVEGTLGHATTLASVPVNLHGEWTTAPLGAVSWVLLGHDAGLRGEMTLTTNIRGTVGDNTLESHLSLQSVRRADFVPERTLNADISCNAQVGEIFHALQKIQCRWPSGSDGNGLTVTGDMPAIRNPEAVVGTVAFKNVPVSLLLDTLRAASSRVSPELKASGTISGSYSYGTPALPVLKHEASSAPAGPSDTLTISKAHLAIGDSRPFLDQDITGSMVGRQLALSPVALALAPSSRDSSTVTIKLDATGYFLRLDGSILPSRLLELAHALPQLGDGIEPLLPDPAKTATESAPIHVDLVSTRTWGAAQTWSNGIAERSAVRHKRSR
jgi:hypothetical protein